MAGKIDTKQMGVNEVNEVTKEVSFDHVRQEFRTGVLRCELQDGWGRRGGIEGI